MLKKKEDDLRACLVCGAESRPVKYFKGEFLRKSLASFLLLPENEEGEWIDYSLFECAGCSLQFAWPLVPAGDEFYRWLDGRGDYYNQDRWEWRHVEKMIKDAAVLKSISVLEFGAGDGRFLHRLKAAGATRVVAIERSAEAVARLESDGIEAYCLDDALRLFKGANFDFVLSFHCLEHVTNPIEFIQQQRQFAGRMGKILFSVPYSPMHFETRMFDPLNHPPHHVTRWNYRSLAALSKRLGEKASFWSPPAYGIFRRVRHALYCEKYGPHWGAQSKARRLLSILRPLAFIKEWGSQRVRDDVNGAAAGDVILVELLPAERTQHDAKSGTHDYQAA